MRLIVYISVILITSSCIGEKTGRCPFWGMYRVNFHHHSNDSYSVSQNITIAVSGDNPSPGLYLCKSTANPVIITSDSPVMLFPGIYQIFALYTGEISQKSRIINLRNGYRYLYAYTTAHIEKRAVNDIRLNFQLANSLITANFTINPEYAISYDLISAFISPPENNNINFNIESGVCNYSTGFSSFFEEMLTDTESNHKYYYCLPVAEGGRIKFRVQLQHRESAETIILNTHINNSSAIEQGMVYSFSFNITPYSLESVGSTVTDWRKFAFGRELIFK